MSKQTGAGIQLSSSVDSFTFRHTPTTHHLTVRGGDIDITGGSGYSYTFPTASTTLVSTDLFQVLTNKQVTGSFRVGATSSFEAGHLQLGKSSMFAYKIGQYNFNYNGAMAPTYGQSFDGENSVDPASAAGLTWWMSAYGGIRFFTEQQSRWLISGSGDFHADGAYHVSTQGSGTFGSLQSSRIVNATSSLTLEVGAGQRLYLDDGHTNSASIAGVVWSTADPSGAYPSGTIWCKYA